MPGADSADTLKDRIKELEGQLRATEKEMEQTRTIIRDYNSLKAELARTAKKVHQTEARLETKEQVGISNRERVSLAIAGVSALIALTSLSIAILVYLN